MATTIRIGWRVAAVALALLTALAITSNERGVAAADNATRQAVKETCLEEGGIYWEEYKDGKIVSFGCSFPEGDELWCSEITTSTGGGYERGCLYTYGMATGTTGAAPGEPAPATGAGYGAASASLLDERQP